MGTHPSGPANVIGTKEPLLSWLGKHPYAVGRVPKGYKGDDLPFMFKVLSVKTALSIQVRIEEEEKRERERECVCVRVLGQREEKREERQ